MSTRKIKKEVLTILQEPDLQVVIKKLRPYGGRDLINPLFSAICRGEERIRWHAISMFGQILSQIAESDLEASRIVMRRFLWSLNDESGGIGWGAPEAMAETMAHSAILFREYHHMLLSYMREDGPELFQDGNYLELPQLQAGLLWGIGRLASFYKPVLLEEGVASDVVPYLHSADQNVRGMAVWCLGILKPEQAEEILVELMQDKSEVTLYLDGILYDTWVGRLAEEALECQ